MSRARRVGTILVNAGSVAMVASGLVMVAKARRGRAEIRNELAAQKITFPEADDLPAGLVGYAGQRVQTGEQAKAFSDLIGTHLGQASGGRTYSEVNEQWLAGGRTDEKLAELCQTAFTGQTLRSSLLGAYQAWQITSLVAGLGALFTGLGEVLFAARVLLSPSPAINPPKR